MIINIRLNNPFHFVNTMYGTEMSEPDRKQTPVVIPFNITDGEVNIVKDTIQYLEKKWDGRYDKQNDFHILRTRLGVKWDGDCDRPEELLKDFRYCLYKYFKHHEPFSGAVRGGEHFRRYYYSEWMMSMIIRAYIREVKLDVNFLSSGWADGVIGDATNLVNVGRLM